MLILAVDPGTLESGWCVLDYGAVRAAGVLPNEAMREAIKLSSADVLAVEMIASYGMPVGREVFETCVWIGRFAQVWKQPDEVQFVYRRDVKLHLCGTSKAKDPNVRQALLDLFPRTGGGKTPQIGVQKQPGPLFGVSTHAWPALGVAITVAHRMQGAIA